MRVEVRVTEGAGTAAARPVLRVIVASTRPGRIGLPIGIWFLDQAILHGAFEVCLTDLAELGLPFMDEPNHPRLRQYTHAHTKEWSALVDEADAFVLVMPEYNHSFTATLKNAIDYLVQEWAHKPVGFVSYGGLSGGIRAVQAIKPVLTGLRMVPLNEAVVIQGVAGLIDEHRHFQPTEAITAAVEPMLNELARQAPVLRGLRGAG
jgi:NAD(P)H-dependent FMN reductase